MEFIAHRINTAGELEETPPEFGVELDIRDFGGRLVMHHDPFTDGEDFERYLEKYRHGTMIVNVKSEGIEYRAMELLEKRGIENFFFLDSSFPMLVRLGREGETRQAVRLSEYESIETVLAVRELARWVWVDCFTRFPLDGAGFSALKEAGFSVCLVSPELQARDSDIETLADRVRELGIFPDAVCTKQKNAGRWRGAIGM